MLVAAVFFFYAFPLSDYLKSPHDQASSPPRRKEQEQQDRRSAKGDSGAEVPLMASKVRDTAGEHNNMAVRNFGRKSITPPALYTQYLRTALVLYDMAVVQFPRRR